MRGMVFAAGLGSRLRPLTDVLPKPLCPVGPWPLVRYAVETLKAAGITEIAINTFHLGAKLPEAIADGSAWGVKITWSHESGSILGTGGGLRKMKEFLSAEGDFAVMNGDTLIDFDLRFAIEKHRASGATATMVLKDDPRVATFGAIGYDPADGRVWDFVGRVPVPAGTPVISKALFTGVHVFSPRVFDHIAPDGEVNLGTETYPALLRAGERVSCVLQQGYWSDLGTADRLYEANLDVLTREAVFSRFDPLAGFAEGPPGVFFGEGAVRGPRARMHRPLLVGHDAMLDAGITVGPGVILGRGVTVLSGSVLERCMVLDGVSVDGTLRDVILAPGGVRAGLSQPGSK